MLGGRGGYGKRPYFFPSFFAPFSKWGPFLFFQISLAFFRIVSMLESDTKHVRVYVFFVPFPEKFNFF